MNVTRGLWRPRHSNPLLRRGASSHERCGPRFLSQSLHPSACPNATRSCLLHTQDAANGRCQAFPLTGFCRELLAAGFRQRVEARSPVVVRGAPFGTDPSLLFEPLQGGVEGAVIDQERVFRLPLNAEGDAVAVLRPEQKRAEDQQIEGALEKGDPFLFPASSRHATRVWTCSGRVSTFVSVDQPGEDGVAWLTMAAAQGSVSHTRSNSRA